MVSSGFSTVELSTFLPMNAEMIEFLAIDDSLPALLKIVLNTTSRLGSKSGMDCIITPFVSRMTLTLQNEGTSFQEEVLHGSKTPSYLYEHTLQFLTCFLNIFY